MIYRFIDNSGTFTVDNPQKYNTYFPLTNSSGTLLSAISPNLSGDIKKDNEHFLTLPASSEDLRSSLLNRRDFFIKTKTEILRLSQPYQDKLEAGFLYHKLTKKTKTLDIEILNFIPHNLEAEVMRITLTNQSRKETIITPTSFIPLYGRSEKNLRDHRHVSSLLNRVTLDKYSIQLKPTMIFDEKGHRENKDIYYCLAYESDKIAPYGHFPTLDSFYGEGDILNPDAIYKNLKPSTKHIEGFDGKETCAGFRFKDKKLRPKESVQYVLILGITDEPGKIKEIFQALDSSEKVEMRLADTQQYWQNYLKATNFTFGDKNFNNWLNWVKFQPTLRKLFGCSFLPHFDYGKGGRGWRDLWQDALALLLTEPQKAKEIITNSFAGVRFDGSNATIITNNGFISDRNKISRVWMDHGVWPYLTLHSYIMASGDLNILLIDKTYFCDHQIKRAKAKKTDFNSTDWLLRSSDNQIYQGSILEHILIQNLVQFFNVGAHNIVKLENADWNDGLDMAADKGESVAFSFMYAHNLKSLSDLLENLKNTTRTVKLAKEIKILLDTLTFGIDYSDFLQKQNKLDEYLSAAANISGEKEEISLDWLINDLNTKYKHMFVLLTNKEWLSEGFFNGYYDNNACRVEGRQANKINMTLTGQVFAIMSGVATDEQISQTWKSLKKYLFDKNLGSFRLNTDFGTIRMDLGRAFGFSYGDKENGAIFSHMVVMLANALYQRGFIKEGFETINSLFEMAIDKKAKIYPVLPEYFNSQGRGLYLYLTGSASWYIYTISQEVLGIKFNYGKLRLEPKLIEKNFNGESEIKTTFQLENKKITVVYHRQKKSAQSYKITSAAINGKPLTCTKGICEINLNNLLNSRAETIEISVELK
jgi:cellobiose phosphorylase